MRNSCDDILYRSKERIDDEMTSILTEIRSERHDREMLC